jgi:hypothetical protein
MLHSIEAPMLTGAISPTPLSPTISLAVPFLTVVLIILFTDDLRGHHSGLAADRVPPLALDGADPRRG